MLKIIKIFIEKHIVAEFPYEFPYDNACWDCRETECDPKICREKGLIK